MQDFSNVVSLTVNLLSQILLVVILTGWLFNIDVRLTLLLIGMTPVAVVIALSFRRIAREVTQRARRVTAKINAQIQESISGITVGKSFRQEQAIYDDFETTNKQAYQVGQEGLDTIMRDRTAIVIAHRLSTVKHADRIIVMDHGRIIEEGNHEGLMTQAGHYAELYNTYFRHQSLEYIEAFREDGRHIMPNEALAK